MPSRGAARAPEISSKGEREATTAHPVAQVIRPDKQRGWPATIGAGTIIEAITALRLQ